VNEFLTGLNTNPARAAIESSADQQRFAEI
jgi:hypothetical protein